jgi:hypothetical protein
MTPTRRALLLALGLCAACAASRTAPPPAAPVPQLTHDQYLAAKEQWWKGQCRMYCGSTGTCEHAQHVDGAPTWIRTVCPARYRQGR